MNLECNLVKVNSLGSKLSKLIARNRYQVTNDTEALDSIAKFIADNASTFNAALSDQKLVTALSNLSNITINDLDCLRYYLSTRGLDIWYYYVSDVEVNSNDIPEGLFEYNIIDNSNMMSTTFIPFCTKLSQSQSENKLTVLYDKINDMYGFYNSPMFTGMISPIKKAIDSMKQSEELLGIVPTTTTSYVNSIFEFLRKDIRVITN